MQSQDESSDSSEEVRHRALPVADLPRNFDPNKAPTTAEEYLHHVMWEARQCKDVMAVTIDKKRIKKQPIVVRPGSKMTAPEGFLPSIDSQQSVMEDFKTARAEAYRLRKSKYIPKPKIPIPVDENPDHWCSYCYGTTFHHRLLQLQGRPVSHNSETTERGNTEPQQPLMSILLNIRQMTLENLMEWNVKWLQESGFSEHQGKWLYCLLTCLEKPLVPELCDNVRQIVFLCAKERAKLENASHPHLCQLNVLIMIITQYFGQDDLADKC